MDDEWEGIDNDEDGDDDNLDSYREGVGRDGLIFLIDCSDDMFIKMKTEEASNAFSLAVKCAVSVMKSKIISSEKDYIAIVLYGTEKSTDSNFQHVYEFQELQQPGAETIIALEKLSKLNTKDKFREVYGINNNYSLSDAFWVCSTLFSKCLVKLATRRILLFTNEDNPHSDNPQLQRLAKQKVRDLQENSCQLDLLHITKVSKNTFNMELFYKSVLITYEDDDTNTSTIENPSEKINELLTRVRIKDYKRRSTGRIPFNLPNGVAFSIAIYNLVLPLRKAYPVKVAKDTNENLQTITKTYLQDSGQVLLPDDIVFYQEYGSRKAYFDKDEIRQMKQLMEPGFNLLGFEKASVLKPHYFKKPSPFIYPDETLIKGSRKLFIALLKRCLDRQLVPVGWLSPRKNSVPELVALLPQAEEFDELQIQITPPGFHAIAIPFVEDMRQLPIEESPVKASEELIEKAKQFIKKLQFKFESTNFENPVIQTQWRNIEALALDMDEPDPLTDSTIPNESVIEERAGKLITEFIIESGINDVSSSASKQKRKCPAQNVPNKATKLEKCDNLEKMTVQELKDFILENNLEIKTSGKKKADLQNEIKTLLNN